MEHKGLDRRAPLGKLVIPVQEGRLGNHHEMRPADILVVLQVAKERDSLEGLAKTHLVCQDSIESVLVQGDHPVEAVDLVVTHRAGDVYTHTQRSDPHFMSKGGV